MTSPNDANIREVDLPFSNGLIAARMWKAHDRFVVGVPQLGLHCYGRSEQEAAFRLFTTLLKYYRQLKNNQKKITEKGTRDLEILRRWVEEIERKMTAPSGPTVISLADHRSR